MSEDTLHSRQGHRLLQVGIGLFLFTSVEGFVLEHFTVARLGLSVHTLSALQGVMLLALGLLWLRLNLSVMASRLAFWLLLYSTFAILVSYLMAGISGAGNSTLPLAAGSAHGSAFQEMAIMVVAYSSAPTGITAFVLILWGLRIKKANLRIETN